MKKTLTLLLSIPTKAALLGMTLSLLSTPSSHANAACPVLMILERSTNSNRVWYESSDEDPETPIVAKWEMREDGPGEWEELTNLEKMKAYGIRTQSKPGDHEFKFSLAAMQDIIFTLKPDRETGCPYISYSQKNGLEIKIQKINLTMKESFFPTASRIQFLGLSVRDGQKVQTEIPI